MYVSRGSFSGETIKERRHAHVTSLYDFLKCADVAHRLKDLPAFIVAAKI
ncbi:hypothetical protein D3OALGB2SA_5100 [Olavius algarvensis associated proteobacterium Delta 3]|nr:hypothetical protein D3OALGB2SA_5100 [Olavius algarvensis associated proteobacterium Delta 3]